MFEGIDDGARLGLADGALEGADDGAHEGICEGNADGPALYKTKYVRWVIFVSG